MANVENKIDLINENEEQYVLNKFYLIDFKNTKNLNSCITWQMKNQRNE